MPSGDRTGPAGTGPMTGRGAGYCAGTASPGYAQGMPGGGGGFGRGRGTGRGRGFGRGAGWNQAPVNYAPPAPTKEQELAGLKNQAQGLSDSLNSIQGRITELEKDKS